MPAFSSRLATALLAWYDLHRRDLPWRTPKGVARDPYRVWLAEVMLQQTTVKAVIPYFEKFLARFPAVADLAAADRDEVLRLWAGLGYYSRARNLHACAIAVMERHGGEFPATAQDLKTLPGIGAYTAGAIAAIAFGERVAAVDGNVERVIARLDALDAVLPQAKPVIAARVTELVPKQRAGDFAEALMELGATVCTPRSPSCPLCPWGKMCKARADDAVESYPKKAAKKPGARRYGVAYVAIRADGAVLIGERPDRGLLGGMTGVPTSDWTTVPPEALPQEGDAAAPFNTRWTVLPETVEHVFTHFPLTLTICRATLPHNTQAPTGWRWSSPNGAEGEALPTLFQKVLRLALRSP